MFRPYKVIIRPSRTTDPRAVICFTALCDPKCLQGFVTGTHQYKHLYIYICQGDMLRPSRSSSGLPRRQIQKLFSFPTLCDPKCLQGFVTGTHQYKNLYIYICQGDMLRPSRSSSGLPRRQIQELFSFPTLCDPKCLQGFVTGTHQYKNLCIYIYICQGDMFRPSRSSSGLPRRQIQELFSFPTLCDPKCLQGFVTGTHQYINLYIYIFVRETCFDIVGHPQAFQEGRSKGCLVFLHCGIPNAYKFCYRNINLY